MFKSFMLSSYVSEIMCRARSWSITQGGRPWNDKCLDRIESTSFKWGVRNFRFRIKSLMRMGARLILLFSTRFLKQLLKLRTDKKSLIISLECNLTVTLLMFLLFFQHWIWLAHKLQLTPRRVWIWSWIEVLSFSQARHCHHPEFNQETWGLT